MLRETVEYFGHNVSARFRAGAFCSFAPAESTAGFIDTSPALDGTRGVAFMCDMLRVNTDGTVQQEYYSDITDVSVIRSYESAFDDELSLTGKGRIRISDASLNKPFLKQLIDTLIRQYSAMSDEERERELSECTGFAARSFSVELMPQEEPVTVPVIAESVIPDTVQPAADKALQPAGAPCDESSRTEGPSAAETVQKGAAEEAAQLSDTEEDELDDLFDEEDVSGMTTEEQLSLLRSSIDEINSTPEKDEPAEAAEEPQTEDKTALTKEPESDDIYIEASAKLREICESGRLSMEQIEGALRENLLTAADAFNEIISRCGIPPRLSDKIAELKKAADGMDKYFELGEDIAARAMFFMLYQMLSYSDRLAETEETKERLNGFFRRWGPSGMTLSMLDRGIL